MKKSALLLLASVGLATAAAPAPAVTPHTPVITPGKGKPGDLPPRLEDKPLPPFATIPGVIPGTVIMLGP